MKYSQFKNTPKAGGNPPRHRLKNRIKETPITRFTKLPKAKIRNRDINEAASISSSSGSTAPPKVTTASSSAADFTRTPATTH